MSQVAPSPDPQARTAPEAGPGRPAGPVGTSPTPRRRRTRLLLGLAAVAGLAAALLHVPTRDRLAGLVGLRHAPAPAADAEADRGRGFVPPSRRRGRVELTAVQAEALGLQVVEARAQTEPTRLEISGTTAYDPNQQNQVRPRFTSLVDRVYVNQGQAVKAGEPLVDVFSAELAAAKSDFEKARARWNHDRKELERAEKLFNATPRAMSEREYLSIANDEQVSNAEQKVAGDKLIVYGLTPAEVQQVPSEVGAIKARMTLRAPADGVVIRKDVVPGNRYDDSDVLMVIANLDHFWVWGNVYPSDATRVRVGQRWVVRSPLLESDRICQIESVTSEVAQDTKSLRIRSRLEDPEHHLKAALLIGGYLEIPPSPGRTVVPRLALVSTDGADYVYVERPDPAAGAAAAAARQFERRAVRVDLEHHDEVVIADGLRPGERVATRGSLILAQIFEDRGADDPPPAP